MKKITVIILAAAAFAVGCKTKNTAATTKSSGEKVATSPKATAGEPLTAEMLAEGKTIFDNSCARCHALPQPSKYSDTKWVGIINAMAPKAKLNARQSELVYNYVTSKN